MKQRLAGKKANTTMAGPDPATSVPVITIAKVLCAFAPLRFTFFRAAGAARPGGRVKPGHGRVWDWRSVRRDGHSGNNPGASQIFSSIYVEPIDQDAGYELRNSLIDLLDASGRKSNPLYSLKVGVKEQLQGAALQNDATITRYNYTLTADYALIDARNGGVVTRGLVSSLSAYNVVASPYATLAAQHDAQRRGADELAQRIRIDLGVFFAKGTSVSK